MPTTNLKVDHYQVIFVGNYILCVPLREADLVVEGMRLRMRGMRDMYHLPYVVFA